MAPHTEVLLQGQGFPGWVEEDSPETGFAYLLYLAQEPGWQERLRALQAPLQDLGVAVSTHGQVRDEDWAENWKRFYHPLPVGKRLVVCPSWEEFVPEAHQKVMILDPGSAFGTGYHWTTRLCLEFLEQVVEPDASVKMLDMGTGSGILAIGARLLGVREIVAVDNDPVAVKVAKENLALNQASDVPVLLADRPPDGPYGLITANLIASLLVELSSLLAACLQSGGRLICGGIIDQRRDEVVAALEAAGLKLSDEKAAEDWVSLLLTKP